MIPLYSYKKKSKKEKYKNSRYIYLNEIPKILSQ